MLMHFFRPRIIQLTLGNLPQIQSGVTIGLNTIFGLSKPLPLDSTIPSLSSGTALVVSLTTATPPNLSLDSAIPGLTKNATTP